MRNRPVKLCGVFWWNIGADSFGKRGRSPARVRDNGRPYTQTKNGNIPMKKVGIVVLVVLALVAAIVVFALGATRGLPKAADAFFAQIKQGNIQEAYLATAAEFRAATGEEEFANFLRASSIGAYQSASWSSRSIHNNQGQLEGTVTTKDGGQIPVVVNLVREGGAWKILSLRKADAGLVRERARQEISPDAALQTLTVESMGWLAEAIQKNDFSDFHQRISRLWQGQITADELKQVFASFVENRIDLTALQGQTPVFSPAPALDDDGILQLEGYYPDGQTRVFFRLKFIYEHPQWKLLGINVRL